MSEHSESGRRPYLTRNLVHRLPYYPQGDAGAPVKDCTSGPGVPDIELIWFPLTVFDDKFPKPPAGTSGITLAAVSLRPESRGRITLKSTSAWDKPLIDPKYVLLFVSGGPIWTRSRAAICRRRAT